jgi:hypothetical protein
MMSRIGWPMASVRVYQDCIVRRLHDGRQLLVRARRCFEDLNATRLAQLGRHPCARCRDGKGHLCGDQAGQLDILRRQIPWFREIQHELPDDALGGFERKERHRGNPLGPNDGQQRRQAGVLRDVGHDDRLGTFDAGCPWRVSFDSPAITVRQLAPCLEAHHAVRIEQKDRRPFDTETALERIECRLVDLLEPVGAIDRVRQLKTDGEWGRCDGQ